MKTWMVPIVAALILTGCGRKTEKPAESEAPAAPAAAADAHKEDANVVKVDPGMMRDLRITTAKVESRSGAEEVVLLGELAVDQRRYAEIGSPVPARVTRLLVAEGDRVRAGEALAELFSPELGRARADFLTATARLTLAESVLQRKRDLAAERIVPLREVQEAEAAFTEAQAALRGARAALAPFGMPPPTSDTDKTSSSAFQMRSAIAGTVIERTAFVGQLLDPATAAFKVGDLSRLWLTVHAFERDAVRITRGAPARLSFAAMPGQPFDGTIALVGREVNKESRTIPVRVDVRNDGGMLRPGMSATAAVPVGASGAQLLAVPVAAVQRVKNEWCVFIPKGDGTFEVRTIGRGRDLGAEVEVLSGLKPGETIVVDGAFLLKAQAEKREGHDDHH